MPLQQNLKNYTIASFESRLALKMEKLIQSFGGKALIAPSMREIPLENNEKAFELYEKLKNKKIDQLILMTGVALRTLMKTLETRFSKEEIISQLSSTQIITRGPKPVTVCNQNKIPIFLKIQEPNTWREIIATLKTNNLLSNKKIAVLEYGVPNIEFINQLTDEKAQVFQVPVYQWDLPLDTKPLENTIEQIIKNNVHATLFTSANQVHHLMKIVCQKNCEANFRRAMQKVAVFSIGPVCSETLIEYQFFPDREAKPNKMENLVELVNLQLPKISSEKILRAEKSWIRLENPHFPESEKEISNLDESLFLKALRKEKVNRIPIWLMRQAGRYMAEYQMIRQKYSFLDLCKNPEISSEVTLTALERLGVDAAIIFSDILIPLEGYGIKLEYKEGFGPKLDPFIRNENQIDELQSFDIEKKLNHTLKAIHLTRKQMASHIPLIGFVGAPFTIASYMIEGQSSREFVFTKKLMKQNTKAWHQLLEKLALMLSDYLNAQIKAGCQAVQIFDSWVGALNKDDYENYVIPHSKNLIDRVKAIHPNIPVIHFGTNSEHLLASIKKAGGDAIGIDSKTNIKKAWDYLGDVAIQGNLDPKLLFEKPEIFLPYVDKILNDVGSKPGFVFNLGHGILPKTPVDHVMTLVDYVHEFKLI